MFFNPTSIPAYRALFRVRMEIDSALRPQLGPSRETIPSIVPLQTVQPIREAQILPVPLEDQMNNDDWHGYHIYQAFNCSIELTIQQRQDITQVAFVEALEALRNSRIEAPHWQTLSSRCQVRFYFLRLATDIRE